ncbi:MAG: hypothetical protein JST22_12785 [Bacteroidetes bacterium]|nr:hypothetical protein [Bacteroidota bacterium]
MNHQQRRLIAFPFALCIAATLVHAGTIVQPGEGVEVSMDWHTIAEPVYGAAMRYTVSNILLSTDSVSTPVVLKLSLTRAEVGAFELTSTPIAVPTSGMSLAYTRAVEMRPTDAERGTMLPNDPSDRRKYDTFGITRAAFDLHVVVIDAATGKPLAEVDKYRFNITRRQELNDIVDNSKVNIDLTPFVGKRILIKTTAFPAYNGRGCVTGSIPHIVSLQGARPGRSIEDPK